MSRADDEPVAVSAALEGILRSLRAPSRREVSGIFGGWAELVGDQIAAHVRPVRLDAGVLLVEVDDPGWATQIRFLADDLIARLQAATGTSIERLEVRVSRSRRRNESG